jgi:hypothetical protein
VIFVRGVRGVLATGGSSSRQLGGCAAGLRPLCRCQRRARARLWPSRRGWATATKGPYRALAVRAAAQLCVLGNAVTKADVAWAPAASAAWLFGGGGDDDAGSDEAREAYGGAVAPAVLLEVAVVADPALAHEDSVNAPGSLGGKFALVVRGHCSFTEKVGRCVAAGAVLVANDDAGAPGAVFIMGNGSADHASAVPVAMASFNEEQRLIALVCQAGVVSF